MLNINFLNVEELILKDREIQKLFPTHLFGHFEQWRLSQHVPAMKQESKKLALDLLDALEEYTDILENYFDETVIVEKLNYHAVWHLEIPLNEEEKFCQTMCQMSGYGNYSTYRDDEFIHISFWR